MGNEADLASLKTEMSSVKENLAEIKSMMTRVLTLHESMAKMQVEHAQHSDAVKQAFKRIDELDAEDGAIHDRVHDVDRKVDKWLNRGIGAWFAASLLFMVIQAGVVYVVRDYNERLNQKLVMIDEVRERVNVLEQKNPR